MQKLQKKSGKAAQNNFANFSGINELFMVFRNFPQPVLVTDDQVKIIFANGRWEKLTGYKAFTPALKRAGLSAKIRS